MIGFDGPYVAQFNYPLSKATKTEVQEMKDLIQLQNQELGNSSICKSLYLHIYVIFEFNSISVGTGIVYQISL
jgi:hypothetical protein